MLNLVKMKSTTYLMKGKSLLLPAIILFAVSCKKENSNGPFVAVATAATDVQVYSFVANWQKTSGAASYNLFIATDSNFNNPLPNYNPASVTGISAIISGLDSTTNYYYKIVAVNSAGQKTAPSNTIGALTGGPADDRFVYIGSQDQNFYCFDARTGAKIWAFNASGDIESSATIFNGTLYFGSTNQRLYSLNLLTGALNWGGLTGGAIISTPAFSDGAVYGASYAGNVYRMDTINKGKTTWTTQLSSNGAQPLFSSPTVVNGMVYIGGEDHNLYGLDAATGKEVWVGPTGDTLSSSPAVSNGVVYVGSSDWKLYAFTANTGNLLWVNASSYDSLISSPTISNGIVYIGSFDGGLYAINASTGALIWRAATGGRIQSSPVVSNGVVYVGSFDNSLYAFDAATGTKKWSTATGNRVMSSPVVGGNAIYVGSYDHNLYAFSIADGKIKWSAPTGNAIRMGSPLLYTFDGRVIHPSVSGEQQ
jgi:eukaryotic-like serine/threonine-protein kinase